MLNQDERQELIARYGNAYEELRAALATFPSEMWRFKPADDEWSIHEQIIHLADAEANSYVRARRAIAEPGQDVIAYDQDRWASTLDYHRQSTDEALELFRLLRMMTHRLLVNLADDVWAQTIEHPENGTMTLDDWLVVYANHVADHITQMHGCYDAWAARLH